MIFSFLYPLFFNSDDNSHITIASYFIIIILFLGRNIKEKLENRKLSGYFIILENIRVLFKKYRGGEV
jgi:hypothetical protein